MLPWRSGVVGQLVVATWIHCWGIGRRDDREPCIPSYGDTNRRILMIFPFKLTDNYSYLCCSIESMTTFSSKTYPKQLSEQYSIAMTNDHFLMSVGCSMSNVPRMFIVLVDKPMLYRRAGVQRGFNKWPLYNRKEPILTRLEDNKCHHTPEGLCLWKFHQKVSLLGLVTFCCPTAPYVCIQAPIENFPPERRNLLQVSPTVLVVGKKKQSDLVAGFFQGFFFPEANCVRGNELEGCFYSLCRACWGIRKLCS